MFRPTSAPVAFVGPSLPRLPDELRGRVEVRPPMQRRDAEELLERPEPGVVVLIDGVFSSTLAVAPMECRALLEAGWTVVGAASMGALRASELWGEGMIGVGEVYALYRLGILVSDAEVAVAVDPRTHRELGLSLVHVRALLQQLVAEGACDRDTGHRMLDHAARLHFLERSWPTCRGAWRAAGMDERALERLGQLVVDPRAHPKTRDAELALRLTVADLWVQRP